MKWSHLLMLLSGFLMGVTIGRFNTKPNVYSLNYKMKEVRVAHFLKGSDSIESYQQHYEEFQDTLNGCRYVYLDVGANIGVQVRKLYEPDLYPSSNPQITQYFDSLFGTPEQRRRYSDQICSIGFELNPLHKERLKALEKCYNKLGKKTYFNVPVAVSNIDNEKVIGMSPEDSKNHFWSTSIVNNRATVDEPNGLKFETSTMNLGKYIMEVVAKRRVPEAKDKNAPPPSVLMKMDIEGSEYQVLTGMLMQGALSVIDMITIEYHDLNPNPNSANPEKSAQESDYAKGFKQMIETILGSGKKYLGKEPLRIIEIDDETYYQDNAPKPIECDFDIPYTS